MKPPIFFGFLGGLLSESERVAVSYYLESVKRNPVHFLDPVYISLYVQHPETKDIEPWREVPNDSLKIISIEYQESLVKSGDMLAVILDYLDRPEDAQEVYHSYGKELLHKGWTREYYTWYREELINSIKENKDMKPEVVTAMKKLAPYTSHVVEKALQN